MPNLINPNYRPNSPMQEYKTQIDDWFIANPNERAVTFQKIRQAFGKTETEWPNNVMHQVFNDWGYGVEI